jgi:prophage maintenance system killer protein
LLAMLVFLEANGYRLTIGDTQATLGTLHD